MTPGKTDDQKNAEATRDTRQASSTADAAPARQNNAQYTGKVTDTDYYKNATAAGSAGTTAAYDSARRNLRQQMEAAGISGDSGVTAGNETALGAQEAHDLGAVKTNAFTDTANQQFKANQQNLDLSKEEDTTGLGYADMGNKDENIRQAQGNANKMALAKAIAGAAAGI